MAMTIPIYQADTFTGQLFGGNPAAICPLNEWLPAETMQKIAAENNLAETAYFVKPKTALACAGLRLSLRLTCAGMPP